MLAVSIYSGPDPPGSEIIRTAFADRLIVATRRLGHPLCVGLDPHLDRFPPLFCRGGMAPAAPETAAAVESFCLAMMDRLAGRVAIVKPQIAFFERLGWRGMQALDGVVATARERGLLVLLDAKRGDIGSTARGYAEAYLCSEAVLAVDAITANPYLGLDTLEPLVKAAGETGAGIFVLVKTSNPGSGDFQDRNLDGKPLYERVAESLAGLAERMSGPETGWSSLGAVVGATYPEVHQRIRELLPRALFLVPGYGAQGGGAREAVSGFVPGPTGRLEGGLVNSSRGILFPPGSDTDDVTTWERAVDEALDRAIGELADAVSA
jgi:orotidine-5'-phosphate decarboxylase